MLAGAAQHRCRVVCSLELRGSVLRIPVSNNFGRLEISQVPEQDLAEVVAPRLAFGDEVRLHLIDAVAGGQSDFGKFGLPASIAERPVASNRVALLFEVTLD
jgi:hypothetical protein